MAARCRGFVMMDAVLAVALVGVLAGLLVTATRRQDRAVGHLADSREAMRLAERTLTDLQAHRAPTAAGEEQQVRIERIAGDAPAGYCWARVDVTLRGRPATLTGLAPAGALPAPAPATMPATAPTRPEGGRP